MRYLTFTTPGGPTIRAINAKSYWLRLRGLIGRKLAAGEGLLLSPCNQIHTFFMAYPIDALYLDPAYRIIRIDASVAPWRLCQRAKGCRYILELPAANAAALGLANGDTLKATGDNPVTT